jgi:hypothetical protein
VGERGCRVERKFWLIVAGEQEAHRARNRRLTSRPSSDGRSGDVIAEVRFIGDAKPAHLDLLKKCFEVAVAKDAMPDEGIPDEPKQGFV